MNYQFIPYVTFLAVSATITFCLAVFSACRYKVNGQPMFSIWMLVCSYWSICNAFELMGTILPVKLFWANLQYASYSFFPVCLFILIAQLTGLWPETKLQNVVLLMIIPIITTVLVWFDEK